jgi:hypothetical protein
MHPVFQEADGDEPPDAQCPIAWLQK